MVRINRREKLALDDAYRYFRTLTKEERTPDLFELANCLKTVSSALRSSAYSDFKLTTRLWQRIQVSLFDKLMASYPAHLVVLSNSCGTVSLKADIPDDAILELHPEGLRRADDVFSIELKNLHPITQLRLRKLWKEKGPYTRPEEFSHTECEGVCAVKPFIIGDDLLQSESEQGKQCAYQKWWELYWQAYCSSDKGERLAIQNEMSLLEAVWGDLYY